MGSRRCRFVLVAVAVAGLSLSTTAAAGPADGPLEEAAQVLRNTGVDLDVHCDLDPADCSPPGNVSVDPCGDGIPGACEGLDWACVETSGGESREAHVCTPSWLSCPDAVDCPQVDVGIDGAPAPVSVHCSVEIGHVDCNGTVGDGGGQSYAATVLGERSPSQPVEASASTGVRRDAMTGSGDALQAGSPAPSGQGVPIGGPVDRDVWAATAAAVIVGAGLAVLYRRLTRDDVLDNALRKRILDEVASAPGIHARELARQLDVSTSTVIYHARVLVDHDLLARREVGRRVAYFRRGDDDPRTQVVQAALSSEAKRRVVEAVSDSPASTISEVAERLDLHRSTVKHHVDALVEDGIVEARREGRCRRLSLADEVAQVFEG